MKEENSKNVQKKSLASNRLSSIVGSKSLQNLNLIQENSLRLKKGLQTTQSNAFSKSKVVRENMMLNLTQNKNRKVEGIAGQT